MPAFANPRIPMLVASALLVLIIAGSNGCQSNIASKLAGRWDMMTPEKLESDSDSEKADSKKAAGDTEDLFNSVAGGDDVGSMSLVFHKNGKLETFTDFPMASTGKPKEGTWKLTSWDEATQTAVVATDLMDEKVETSVRFIDENTIELVPPNIAVLKMKLRFQRKK